MTVPTPAAQAAADYAATLVSVTGGAFSGVDPTERNMPAGQALRLRVAVPETVPMTTAEVPLTPTPVPVTATVAWDFGNAGGDMIPPLYRIIEGDLWSPSMLVVFSPIEPRTQTVVVNVSVTVSVAGATKTVSSADPAPPPGLSPLTFAFPAGWPDYAPWADLSLVGPLVPLGPGVTGTVGLTQAAHQISGTLTSVAEEIPDLKLRGAIPVGVLLQGGLSLLESAMGAVSGAAGGVVGSVADLLGDNPVIPIALDVQGARTLKTYTPDPTAVTGEILQDTPGDVTRMVNRVPVGSWLVDFPLVIGWTVTPPAGAVQSPSTTRVAGAPPSLAVTLPPSFDGTPKTWTVSADVTYDPPGGGSSVTVGVGSLPLVQLPLAVPSVVVMFRHFFGDTANGPQQVYFIAPPNAPTQYQYSDPNAMVSLLQKTAAIVSSFPDASWFPDGVTLNQIVAEMYQQPVQIMGWLPVAGQTADLTGITFSAWATVNLQGSATMYNADGTAWAPPLAGTTVQPMTPDGWNDRLARLVFS